MYPIVADKLKTGNFMFTVKKANGSMTNNWQETADEIMNGLFLKEDEAMIGDRPTTVGAVELNEIKEYIKRTRANKLPGPERIKAEIRQKSSDITALLLTEIINNCFKKRCFAMQKRSK